MGELNYLRIAQLLGGQLTRTPRPRFGGFSVLTSASNQLRLIEEANSDGSIPEALYSEVAAAFETTREGFELDRVLVDPRLRKELVDECRRRGVIAPERDIFKRLQGFRKNDSAGVEFKPTKRRANIDVEGVFYAAELAFRQLNFVSSASVDAVITDPSVGAEFDEVCAALAPHGTSMQFRWAALKLRKTRCLSKEKVDALLDIRPSLIEMKLTERISLADFRVDRVPEERGVFSFTEQDGEPQYLYVGSARSLRDSVAPFEDATPFKLAGGEFWKPNLDRITLSYGIMKNSWLGASPRELGLRLIRSRHPLFNVPVGFERAA
jgi:hypothetical protein